MKDSEKIFIVFYLDVSEILREDVHEYLNKACESFHGYFDDSIKTFFVPSDENKIEFYSMKDMTPVTEEILKNIENKFNEFIKEKNNE